MNPSFSRMLNYRFYKRDNLLRVLQKANWKIKGADGAAELLGVKPSTLLSRVENGGSRNQQLLEDKFLTFFLIPFRSQSSSNAFET